MSARYRLDRLLVHSGNDPVFVGIYKDRGRALAAADAAVANLAAFDWSMRFILYPIEQGALPDGDHEVLVARPLVRAEEARRRAEAVVGRFDQAWLVISSLRASVRDQARQDLVDAIAAALVVHS